MQHRHTAAKYLVAGMVASMFLWGLNWPSGKVLIHYCSPVNLMVYRFILVAAVLAILLPSLRVSLAVKKKGIPFLLLSGVLLAAYNYITFVGLKKGMPGAGGVLVTTLNPIMAYSLGILFNRRLPSAAEAAGLVLGLAAGCVLLQVWDSSTAIWANGNLYFLLAAFLWAVMSTFTARGAAYGSSMGFSFWQYLVTLLCMLPLTDLTEMRAALHNTDALFWANLFFGAVIVTSLATTVYFYTTTRIGPEKASSFMFLVPLAAAVSSWLFLGERLQLHTAAGGMMGIAVVYIMNRRNAARASPSVPSPEKEM